jgi:PIN domain nuclease of toxin-antitoxin system
MRILLDTCEFLWLVSGDAKLPASVAAAVRDPQNEVFLSAVSFWEICVKYDLGKLPLPQPPAQLIPEQRARHLISSLADKAAKGIHGLAAVEPCHLGRFFNSPTCSPALAQVLPSVIFN